MKIILRAALTAASIANIGSAHAGDGGSWIVNRQFISIPGDVAQGPAQGTPVVVAARNGEPIRVYGSHSNQGTWVFPPSDNAGASS